MANRTGKMNEDDRHIAKCIAMVIRNAMEDFHVRHLTDDQMKELNPIVRNAVFTALHALRHRQSSEAAQSFMIFQERMIPKYWEEPQLLDDYVNTLRLHGEIQDQTDTGAGVANPKKETQHDQSAG